VLFEDSIFRSPPTREYLPTQACLEVPTTALEATLASLRRFGPLASCDFWYGVRDGDSATVAGVLTPQQSMSRGNYHVSPAAMSEMLGQAEDSWKPLAQIHSHPGPGVEHSRYDDRMTSSRRALSIVFPFYGHWSGRWPQGIGIHEWQVDYWHLLSDAHASQRVHTAEPVSIQCRDLRR
jgi:proteasome lid subunit RPN8/RPN11